MADRPKEKRKYQWHAMMNSGGSLDLSLFFKDRTISKKVKEKALASGIAQSVKHMLRQGYVTPSAKFMSSTDVSDAFGRSRQYWEKLLHEGKIPYRETSAGRITTDIWVQGYLNNKESVDDYVRKARKVVRYIQKQTDKHSKTECPECGDGNFDYNINMNNRINGLCRTCGFKVNTLAEE